MSKEMSEFYAKDRSSWRRWLEKNHVTAKNVWLLLHKKSSAESSVTYAEAVEEALCFGWIDSKPNKRDEHTYVQFFSERKAKSVWSKINKARIKQLMKDGKMTAAGLAKIEQAKADGSWKTLDEIEELIMPVGLQQAFKKNKKAATNFAAFPPSAAKAIYQWIVSAKTDATRDKRIAETVEQAALNIRANQWKPR